jgi:predicted transcriptional regulator
LQGLSPRDPTPLLGAQEGWLLQLQLCKERRNLMKKTNHLLKLFSVFLYAVILILVLIYNANASTKFTKETGKKCTECHSKIPKKGEADLYLTELGKKFKENGNKMPEEKK